mmetsp:Transcript_10805/g.35825  ORF Transcript_10805/g.35825 Transcript_10805/m.35825 type:complete len:177 (-) Transcript_10805:118-648(-)
MMALVLALALGISDVDRTCGYESAAALGDDGLVLSWGRTHKTQTAAECCDRCLAQAARKHVKEKPEQACNVWVWCPHPTRCWANDIWNHSFGECWLKRQRDPLRSPKYNARGRYPAGQRRVHTTMPPAVQWVSGVIGRGARGGKGWAAADDHVANCFGTECQNEFVRLRQKAQLPE